MKRNTKIALEKVGIEAVWNVHFRARLNRPHNCIYYFKKSCV